MLLRRLLLSSSALLLLLAGCASMGNTLAQDLAWQRVEKCQRIGAAVTVNRVEPNGTIWYEWRGGSQGVSEFEACLKNAAAEQAKQLRSYRESRRNQRMRCRPHLRCGSPVTSGPIGTRALLEMALLYGPWIVRRRSTGFRSM